MYGKTYIHMPSYKLQMALFHSPSPTADIKNPATFLSIIGAASPGDPVQLYNRVLPIYDIAFVSWKQLKLNVLQGL